MTEGQHLQLSTITKEQSGSYECIASNDISSPDVRIVQVTVNCKRPKKIKNTDKVGGGRGDPCGRHERSHLYPKLNPGPGQYHAKPFWGATVFFRQGAWVLLSSKTRILSFLFCFFRIIKPSWDGWRRKGISCRAQRWTTEEIVVRSGTTLTLFMLPWPCRPVFIPFSCLIKRHPVFVEVTVLPFFFHLMTDLLCSRKWWGGSGFEFEFFHLIIHNIDQVRCLWVYRSSLHL